MDEPFPDGMLECIKNFLQEDHYRIDGEDIYNEVFDTDLFFPLQRKQELIQMIRIARRYNPRVIMEIGADKGGGLYHWCKCLTTVREVIACEIRGTPYKHLFETNFKEIKFLWEEKSSHLNETLVRVNNFLDSEKRIDVLFIDGDKNGMLLDFDMYRPLMNDHSVVFLHDIRDGGPKKAFDTIKDRGYKTQTIINISDVYDAIEREGRGEPASTPYEGWLRHWRGRSCGVGVVFIGEMK